jgi:hypothetical protein
MRPIAECMGPVPFRNAAGESFGAGKLVERANGGDAALVVEHDNFCSARDGETIFAAGGRAAAGSGLGEEDLSDVAVGADLAGDAGYGALHAGVLWEQDTLAREKDFEERGVQDRCADEPGDGRQDKDDGGDDGAVVLHEVTGCTKPAEESGDGEAVEGGDAGAGFVGWG